MFLSGVQIRIRLDSRLKRTGITDLGLATYLTQQAARNKPTGLNASAGEVSPVGVSSATLAGSVSIAVVVAVAPLLIETLLEPVASILRQILEAVPLLAQVFFISGRKILPALIVSLNSIFLSRRKIAPIVIGRPCAIDSQEQKRPEN